MKEQIEKTLVPLERIVPIIAKKNPRTRLERIIEMFGENTAAQIMIEFAGQALYFPRVSTLNREVTAFYIKQELKNLRKDRPEFKKRARQLAHLFKMPERRILKIYRNSKYVF